MMKKIFVVATVMFVLLIAGCASILDGVLKSAMPGEPRKPLYPVNLLLPEEENLLPAPLIPRDLSLQGMTVYTPYPTMAAEKTKRPCFRKMLPV